LKFWTLKRLGAADIIARDIEKLTEHWDAESAPFAADRGLRSLSRSG